MRRFIYCFATFCILASAHSETVFKIGEPDGYSKEFKIFRNLGDDRQTYEKGFDVQRREFRDVDGCVEFFKNPVVYTVGKSTPKDWPFVHPFANCPWAGIQMKAPVYKIEFDTPKSAASKKDWYFKLSLTDCCPSRGVGFKIILNGKDVGRYDKPYEYVHYWEQPKPYDMTASACALPFFPESWGSPSKPLNMKLDSSLFKSDGSKNVLEIVPQFSDKATMRLWVTYDWLELSDSPDFPAIRDRRLELVNDAIKAMGSEEVVFCTRGEGRDYHWYANYGKSVCADTGVEGIDKFFNQELFSRMGGKLVVYNLKTGAYRYLINDPKGCVRDPQVSYDGKKIIFSYRKGDDDLFHLYEIDADGKNLTKLPIAGNWNDIEPCYMPNGDILYTSDRLNKTVQCFFVPVSNMHRWFRDENVIRCITVNPDVDNRPEMMPDGRIVYMRWDYNHRTQLGYHSVWTINPDGSNDMTYLGNDRPGGLYIGAKPLNGKDGILFTLAPGHGHKDHKGYIARAEGPFDPSDPHAFQFVSGESGAARYHDPYPLKGGLILATDGFRIVVMGEGGQSYENFKLPDDLLASDAEVYYNVYARNEKKIPPKCRVLIRNVQPLAPRAKGQLRPDLADFSEKTATVFLQDVYQGRKMADVKKGSIKKLMITQMLPEPVHYHGGTMPLNMQGGFAIEKILGTVPVQEDGSAYFEVPSQKALAFIALDENDVAVKRMHSFSGFAPGTSTSCIGCHERRSEAPIRKVGKPMAYGKLSKIEPIKGVPEIIDYLRHVQPILDKYCVECHGPKVANEGVYLTGDIGVNHIFSRYMLANRGQLRTGWNQWGNLPPYTFGSGGSKLMDKLNGKHHNKKLEPQDMRLMKAWLDSGAFAIGTYAAAGTGFMHDHFYETTRFWEKDFPDATHKINEVVGVVCGKCHDKKDLPWAFNWQTGHRIRVPDGKGGFRPSKYVREVLYSLSRPETSVVLMLPLAKEHGGLAEDGVAGKHPVVFKSKDDYEYKKLYGALKKASDYMKANSPFQNQENFFPSPGYVRMMQKCGILPPDHPMRAPLDAMEIDRKYFEWQEKNIEKKF